MFIYLEPRKKLVTMRPSGYDSIKKIKKSTHQTESCPAFFMGSQSQGHNGLSVFMCFPKISWRPQPPSPDHHEPPTAREDSWFRAVCKSALDVGSSWIDEKSRESLVEKTWNPWITVQNPGKERPSPWVSSTPSASAVELLRDSHLWFTHCTP